MEAFVNFQKKYAALYGDMSKDLGLLITEETKKKADALVMAADSFKDKLTKDDFESFLLGKSRRDFKNQKKKLAKLLRKLKALAAKRRISLKEFSFFKKIFTEISKIARVLFESEEKGVFVYSKGYKWITDEHSWSTSLKNFKGKKVFLIRIGDAEIVVKRRKCNALKNEYAVLQQISMIKHNHFFVEKPVGYSVSRNDCFLFTLHEKKTNLSDIDFASKSAGERKQMIEILLRAVAELHSKGFTMRDYHFGNIMIDVENHKPLLIDFGLGKRIPKEDMLRTIFYDLLTLSSHSIDYRLMQDESEMYYAFDFYVEFMKKKIPKRIIRGMREMEVRFKGLLGRFIEETKKKGKPLSIYERIRVAGDFIGIVKEYQKTHL